MEEQEKRPELAKLFRELYSGHPNRVERHMQYDAADMDSEINAYPDTTQSSTQVTDDDNTLEPTMIAQKVK